VKPIIEATPPAGGLFSVARDAAADIDPEEWQFGWQVLSACPAGGTWCCDDSESGEVPTLKESPLASSVVTFSSFDVYQVIGCTAGTSALGNWQAVADSWLRSNVEGWVTAGLEVGVCSNPSLVGLTDITPAGAVCMANAVTALLQARQAVGIFDKPTIHFPSWAAPYWDSSSAVNDLVNVVFGTGYGVLAAAVIDETAGWAYITGNVEYALGVGTAPALKETSLSERRQNMVERIAERRAVVRFDPCGSFKIVFCIPACDGCALPAIAGVTAGAPGSFTPSRATIPESLAALIADPTVGVGGTAAPVNPWSLGQYVLLGDASHAHWNGSTWIVGDAPRTEPTNVTAGIPGVFVPAWSTAPDNFADLAASLTIGDGVYVGAAWTTGQRVVLGDASTAYWNGAAWVAGIAP